MRNAIRYTLNKRTAVAITLLGLALALAAWLGLPALRKPKPGSKATLQPIAFFAPTGQVSIASSAPGTLVYTNDFEAGPGSSFPEWSSSPIRFSNRFGLPLSGTREPGPVRNVESPRGHCRFLGEFGGPRLDPIARTRVTQTIRLALKELAPHSHVTLSFDLLVLKSWDGSSPRYGPDRWSVRVVDGPILLDTTFSNNPKLDTDQSFQDYPIPHTRPQAGASARRTLGYTFFGDSIYHFRFTFPHTAATVTFDFASDLFEGKGTRDESWGLDNVAVSIGESPQPAAHPESGERSGCARAPH